MILTICKYLQVTGSDEENYPLTRTVQRDMWLHQHPLNCSDPSIKFLVADWERLPGFGIGAQIESMSGLLAIAINRKRVLVTNYYNRADHDGCKGVLCNFFIAELNSVQDCQLHSVSIYVSCLCLKIKNSLPGFMIFLFLHKIFTHLDVKTLSH